MKKPDWTEQERKEDWIMGELFNNEVSSDEELKTYFMENGVSEKEATWYVEQRDKCLLDPYYPVKKYKGGEIHEKKRT